MAGRKSSQKRTGRGKQDNSGQILSKFKQEMITIAALALAVLFLLCNFGICGSIGNFVRDILFGLFGIMAYILPVCVCLAFIFKLVNKNGGIVTIKIVAGTLLFVLIGILIDLILGGARYIEKYDIKELYTMGVARKGSGAILGSVSYGIHKLIGTPGTVLLVIVLGAISFVILTEKSLIQLFRDGANKTRMSAWEYEEQVREKNRQRRAVNDEKYEKAREQRRLNNERWRQEEEERRQLELERQMEEDEKILRVDKKVSGVSLASIGEIKSKKESMEIPLEVNDTTNINQEKEFDANDLMKQVPINEEETIEIREVEPNFIRPRDEAMHPISVDDFEDDSLYETVTIHAKSYSNNYVNHNNDAFNEGVIEAVAEKAIEVPGETMMDISVANQADLFNDDSYQQEDDRVLSDDISDDEYPDNTEYVEENSGQITFGETAEATRMQAKERPKARKNNNGAATFSDLDNYKAPVRKNKPYKLPPIDLLNKSKSSGKNDNKGYLNEMAEKLILTLETFGVKAHIIDVAQGPSVTRYELQPDPGVKVSKIVGLADDIKLNLAATDIRIEAPIPGKSAVGIEVPNATSEMVAFRDLVESKEFKEEASDKNKLSFAVGKDIGGKTVLTNIGKMPHALIAGATGSGKSVCINTLILSLLYKFSPDELKLIMVDPKVVELSVYNGIPHLMVPVVTDPKKAAASLQWAVTEMTNRYKKFADMSVRNLEGYNKKVEGITDEALKAVHKKLPYIVIIVDEMADLMMVAAKEVEDSIARLAALARACGIHLILATQRPSVDVITGVIKANMPSRVAFAVSSQIDSRTILDMAGAEKLLGKGDMLFFPQGFPKPVRLQGAFVSDEEVEKVVSFIKVQKFLPEGQDEIAAEIDSLAQKGGSSNSSTGSGGDDSNDDRDDLFEKAGRFIIEKDKASIGNLQRAFKIGFNRAARIMDQLNEAGIVGDEEGTKPRKILMSMEQFELFLEEH